MFSGELTTSWAGGEECSWRESPKDAKMLIIACLLEIHMYVRTYT